MNRPNEGFRQLERTMSRAWPSFDATDYDGWVLRFADGYTKRANSVNPHFDSSLPLATKIAHCESTYRERGLPTIFRLTPFSQPANLDDALAELGYEILDPTLVMTCSVNSVLVDEVDSDLAVSSDQWHRTFEQLRELGPFEMASHRKIVQTSEGEQFFAAILPNSEAKACGLGVHIADAIGLFDLLTHEAYRRQGLGSSIVRSILGWARQRNARTGFLQVHSQNIPARRLYERFGFSVIYPYWYRIKR